jgi:GxxExxY protein
LKNLTQLQQVFGFKDSSDNSSVMKPNDVTRNIIGAAIEVHRALGPGKPEVAYERALAHELGLRGHSCHSQKPVPVVYKNLKLECGYRLDLLVDGVVIEVKSVEAIHPVHQAQVLTYMKLGGWKLALLLNFNVPVLRMGIKRLVLNFSDEKETAETRNPQRAILPSNDRAPLIRGAWHSGDMETERLAREVLACAMEVHQQLGPGLLASAYEVCLCHELHLRGLGFVRRRVVPLSYKGVSLIISDEVRLLVSDRIVVSSHSLPTIEAVHESEMLSHLRLGGWRLGLLINFNSVSLADGIRRVILSGTAPPTERT